MDNYKEYLDPKDGYALVKKSVKMPVHPNWIEIPDDAELYVYWRVNDTYNFQAEKSYFENGSWQPCAWTVEEIKSDKAGAKILWQRPTQDPALISGRDAWLASFDGEHVQYRVRSSNDEWDGFNPQDWLIEDLKSNAYEFRLKPQTIKLDLEIPAPFQPKEGEECCYISDESIDGYHTVSYNSERYSGMIFGLYRPSDIEKVVALFRSAFGGVS